MRNGVRAVVGLVAGLALLSSSVGVAGALWSRGFSDVESFGNDESICEDAWTISATLEDHIDYGSNPPTLGDVQPTVIRLYASAEDAEFGGVGRNPIIEIPIDQVYRELRPASGVDSRITRIWYGETTVTPPPGHQNGTIIYAQAFDLDPLQNMAVPLTVGGEERYGCAPEPTDLEFTLHSPHSWLFLRSWLPHVITFSSANIDLTSITIGTDDVAAQPALAAWSWRGIGVALFSPRRLGTTCAATKLIVTAETLDGAPLAGSVDVTPAGGCRPR
jgi:hypothetical protein